MTSKDSWHISDAYDTETGVYDCVLYLMRPYPGRFRMSMEFNEEEGLKIRTSCEPAPKAVPNQAVKEWFAYMVDSVTWGQDDIPIAFIAPGELFLAIDDSFKGLLSKIEQHRVG